MLMIAEEAGVSKATVSLALRGHPSIPASTRNRIKEIADKHSYHPDPAISAIASSRWKSRTPDYLSTMAYVINTTKESKAVQLSFFDHANQAAQESGYKLEVFDINSYPSPKACSRVLYSRGIRGLLLGAPKPRDILTVNLDWDKFTAVCLSLGYHRVPIHYVTNDIFHATRLAWEKAFEYGYRRIGAALYLHQPAAEDDYFRLGGSFAAREILPIESRDHIPFLTCNHENKEAFLSWYRQYRPEVVIAFNSRTYEFLQEEGIRVPEDVAVINLKARRLKHTQLAGIADATQITAQTAIELLISEIKENNWGIPKYQKSIMIEPVWLDGHSLPRKTPA